MRQKLEQLFEPRSIAVIGASEREGSAGRMIMENLTRHGFPGSLYPVSSKHSSILGMPAYSKVGKIPEPADLAIFCAPFRVLRQVVDECVEANIGSILFFGPDFDTQDAETIEYINKKCKQGEIRMLGPYSLGYIHPHKMIYATNMPVEVRKGNLALVSQSGPLLEAMLDWAGEREVGFSQVISLGLAGDIDFADCIDFLGTDAHTAGILIYIEKLPNARRFLSAARSFSRNKPIIILKANRKKEDIDWNSSVLDWEEEKDFAYDAAFQRAGIIRVDTIAQLFNMGLAATNSVRPTGNNMVILSNIAAGGILALDALLKRGGKHSILSEVSVEKLNTILPHSSSADRPIHVGNFADTNRYTETLKICLNDDAVDAIIVVYSVYLKSEALKIAQAISQLKPLRKPVFTVWMGGNQVAEARRILGQAKIPCYPYPESAIDTLMRLYQYHLDLKLLYETPLSIPIDFNADQQAAKWIIDKALAENRLLLSEKEGHDLLLAYGFPVIESFLSTTVDEAKNIAQKIGFPIVMKIDSIDILQKTAVGGVRLNIRDVNEMTEIWTNMMLSCSKAHPTAVIKGIRIEKMILKGFDLFVGSYKDPTFGPLMLFGKGGWDKEVFPDIRVGLPPLNMALAQQMVEGTYLFTLLKGYRNQSGVQLNQLYLWLHRFSYLLMDFPAIAAVEINPFRMDNESGMALHVAVRLQKTNESTNQHFRHLALSPYPGKDYYLDKNLRLGQSVHLRPVRPEDEPGLAEMLKNVSRETLYMRFFGYIPKIDHTWLTRFTHIDYDREIAIVATIPPTEDKPEAIIGIVRIIEDAWRESAEYSILIADHWQGQGLGLMLTNHILDIAQKRGIKKIVASVLPNNESMIKLFVKKGFTIDKKYPDVYEAFLILR
ncbi:MAG: GNAT family N-acetyltransferase [Bacteroidota bacterium]